LTPTPTVTVTCGSLQALIDAAPAGSVLGLPACVYRETVTITKPLTLDGQHHAELRGSDVWTNWSASGGGWASSQVYPNVGDDSTAGTGPNGPSYLDYFRAFNLEQVFIDGKSLTHVPSGPSSGQFTLDASRHVVLVDNPNGHLVEITVRKRWVNTQSDNVVLTNLAFHDAATGAFESGVSSDIHKGFVLSNSTLTDAHGTMAGAGGQVGSGEKILNNTFVNAGDIAMGGYLSDQVLMQSNTFIHNGYGGWDPAWQAGAVKFSTATNLTLDGNTVADTFGMGLWCDIHCANVTISNNKVHDATDVGIHFEISNGAHIFGNAVWNVGSRQQSPGIYTSNSGDAEIDHNTVYNTAGAGLFMYDANRPDTGTVQNNYFHDNVVAETVDGGALALGFGDYGNGVATSTNQRGSNNAFWYPVPEGSAPRYWWGASLQTSSLALFNMTPGGSGTSRYLSNTEKDLALSAAGIPH
jgi:parallel beta-helix repeat protein